MLTLMRSLGMACLALCVSAGLAHAIDIDLLNADGTKSRLKSGGVPGAANMSLGTCIAGENFCDGVDPNSYVRVRSHFLPTGPYTADALVHTGVGFVNHMVCYGVDNAATAGSIVLYDNTAAGSGTILYSWTVAALDYHVPTTILIQVPVTVGIYIDYTTTNDITCMVYKK
jgi:hypothetical protein